MGGKYRQDAALGPCSLISPCVVVASVIQWFCHFMRDAARDSQDLQARSCLLGLARICCASLEVGTLIRGEPPLTNAGFFDGITQEVRCLDCVVV